MSRFALRSRFLVLSSCAAALACGTPASDDADSIPEFSGSPTPGVSNGVPQPGQAPNAAAATGVPGGSSQEQVGSNPSSVPLAGSAGAPGSANNTGAGATPPAASPSTPAPSGSGGAGGSTPAPTTDTGSGGSAMPAAAGADGVPVDTAGAPSTPPADNAGTPPMALPPAASDGSGCAQGAQFFCEDFDAAPLGALQGNLDGLRPERNVSIIDEAGRGRVLQVQSGPTYDNKSGVFLENLPALNGDHFGRAFIRVAEFPATDSDHWVVVEATSSSGGDQVRPAGGQFSRWAPGADGPSANDWTDWQQSNAATAAGAWECVEWQIDGNSILLWVDGQEVRPQERGNFRVPPIDELWFGFVVYQNGQPAAYDVRFDDIALSTERIGCN